MVFKFLLFYLRGMVINGLSNCINLILMNKKIKRILDFRRIDKIF